MMAIYDLVLDGELPLLGEQLLRIVLTVKSWAGACD